MRWPLVSRTAFDLVVDERDRLRAVNDNLLDHLKRVGRAELGLTEEPRKPPPPQAPVPDEIKAYVKAYPRSAQSRVWRDIIQQNPTGNAEKWREMVAELPNEEDEEV